MKKQSKDVERYLKEVGKQLRVAKKERRDFLEGYRSYIFDYIEEDGQPFDYNRLIRFFGTPASVAKNYVWSGNGQVGVVKHKYMQYTAYGFLALFLLFCVSMLCYVLIDIFVTIPSNNIIEMTNTFY